MKKQYTILSIAFVLLALINPKLGKSQITIVKPYPINAQPISRALTTGDLTVRVAFTSACTEDTITISLPPSVEYVPSSLVQTGGSLTISEADITNLRTPRFKVSDVASTGDIIFIITRKAGCGNLASGKDTILVEGSCGSELDNDPVLNTYNLLAPALSVNPPTPITGALIGTTATRNIVVTNGGNGDLDTLFYYVVYEDAGIRNTAAGNAITFANVSFNSYKTNGDTIFYKLFGPTLFGGDNLMANGEYDTIKETIEILKCNSNTKYAAGWGITNANICEWALGNGNVAMAGGVPSLTTITHAEPGYIDRCTPYDVHFTATNGGTGNDTAAGMFNVKILHAYVYPNAALRYYPSTIMTYTNGRINGNVVTTFSTAGDIASMDLNDLFPTSGPDPDGVGGLTDLDGDGFYDDLPRGQSVTYTLNLAWKCNLPCGIDKIHYSGGRIDYTDMCGNVKQSESVYSYRPIYESSFTGTSYIPTNVFNGDTVTIELKEGHYTNSYYKDNVNTRYRWKLVLPAGFVVPAGAANARYGGAATTYTQVADTVIIISSTNSLRDASINLMLDCTVPGAGGTKNFYYELTKIDNIVTPCTCQGNLVCTNVTATAFCPGPCPAGPTNYIPTVSRVDNSLGWTDVTMATRQSKSNVSAYDLKRALFLDTIQILGEAIQNNAANNLHLELSLGRVGTTVNKLTAVDAYVEIWRGTPKVLVSSGTTTTVVNGPNPGTTQTIGWDLTSGIGAGLLPMDSISSISRYVVATNSGLPQNDVQQGGVFIHYNLVAGVRDYCLSPVAEMYLMGTNMVDGRNGFYTQACDITALGGSGSNLARRLNTSGELYPDEFRPVFFIDSVVMSIPDGYDLISMTNNIGGGTLTPDYNNGKEYTYINPGTWNPVGLTVTNSYGASFVYRFQPTCKTQATATHGIKFYIKDYYYALAGSPSYPSTYTYILGAGSGNTASRAGYKNQTVVYSSTQKPILVEQNLTGVVVASKLQEYWDIEIRNDGLSTAANNWVALEKTVGSNITVDSVVLLSSGATLVRTDYGPGNVNSWYQVSTSGIASASKETVRIFFKYANCTVDSLRVFTGWNCGSYPSPDPVSDANACSVASLFAKIIPNETQVQLSVTRQPGNGVPIDLCTLDSVLVQINSAQSAYLVNPKVEILPPAGVTVVTPIAVEFPLGSGNYQNATTTVIPGGYSVDLTSHTGIGIDGIPGTINNPDAPGRQAKLKVEFNTDCALSSGNPIIFKVFGDKPCGSVAIGNGVSVKSNGVDITGVGFIGVMGLGLSLPADSFKCGDVRTLSLTSTPVLEPSKAGDTITYTLPKGLKYLANFIQGTNCATCSVTTSAGALGTTIVKVGLDVHPADTTMRFSFDVGTDVLPGCGNSEITASAKRDIPPFTCLGVPCPYSSAIIAIKSSDIIILRPSVTTMSGALKLVSDTSSAKFPSPDSLFYQVQLRNDGLDTTHGLYIKFFTDKNGNDMLDAGETVYGQKVTDKLFPGQTKSLKGVFSDGSGVFDPVLQMAALIVSACDCMADSFAAPQSIVPFNYVPLAVDWIYFNANYIGSNKVKLNWATASEEENTKFSVERSLTGDNFTSIATVKGKGTNGENSYEYIDNVMGLNVNSIYYRIKETNLLNGSNSTMIREVFLNPNNIGRRNMKLYPNPTSQVLNIRLNRWDVGDKAVLTVVDLAGKVVILSEMNSIDKSLDMSMLKNGMYLVKVKIGEETYTDRITLIK